MLSVTVGESANARELKVHAVRFGKMCEAGQDAWREFRSQQVEIEISHNDQWRS